MTELIVNTKYGKVEGFVKDGVSRWYGIPYAKPPVDDLRYRRAVECDPWKEVKKCTQFGGRPYQFKLNSVLSRKNDTEDCLYLNIWRKNSGEKNLPVYVWIHGGYLHCYAAHYKLYDDDTFAKEGLLFISIGYRLGPLGCYDFSIYDKEAFDSNCCLSDQIMALKWIKENISAFGGDPNNITINGESAGGASVLALLCCPSAKGLFQKAICQSGYPDGHHSARSNKLLMDMFLEYLKIKPEEAKKIRDLDIKTLQSATGYVLDNLSRYPGIYWPSFVYDDLLPEDCYTSLRNGSANGVKLIIGTNKNEATMFNSMHECPKNKEEIKKMFENNDMLDKFQAIEDFYYSQKKGGDSSPTLNFGKDYMFLLGSLEVADILSQNNQDVWMYRFDFMPPLPKLIGMKATHVIDVHTVFSKSDFLTHFLWLFTKPSCEKMLYNYVHNSWVNFAKTGNPNGDHLTIEWKKYDDVKRNTIIFDRELSLRENPEKETIDLWKNVIKTHRFYI
jgi:para-nitrobenzyl esterase